MLSLEYPLRIKRHEILSYRAYEIFMRLVRFDIQDPRGVFAEERQRLRSELAEIYKDAKTIDFEENEFAKLVLAHAEFETARSDHRRQTREQ
jgi:hypothetical protein